MLVFPALEVAPPDVLLGTSLFLQPLWLQGITKKVFECLASMEAILSLDIAGTWNYPPCLSKAPLNNRCHCIHTCTQTTLSLSRGLKARICQNKCSWTTPTEKYSRLMTSNRPRGKVLCPHMRDLWKGVPNK